MKMYQKSVFVVIFLCVTTVLLVSFDTTNCQCLSAKSVFQQTQKNKLTKVLLQQNASLGVNGARIVRTGMLTVDDFDDISRGPADALDRWGVTQGEIRESDRIVLSRMTPKALPLVMSFYDRLSANGTPTVYLTGGQFEDCIFKVYFSILFRALQTNQPLHLVLVKDSLNTGEYEETQALYESYLAQLPTNSILYENGIIKQTNVIYPTEGIQVAVSFFDTVDQLQSSGMMYMDMVAGHLVSLRENIFERLFGDNLIEIKKMRMRLAELVNSQDLDVIQRFFLHASIFCLFLDMNYESDDFFDGRLKQKVVGLGRFLGSDFEVALLNAYAKLLDQTFFKTHMRNKNGLLQTIDILQIQTQDAMLAQPELLLRLAEKMRPILDSFTNLAQFMAFIQTIDFLSSQTAIDDAIAAKDVFLNRFVPKSGAVSLDDVHRAQSFFLMAA